MMLMSLEQAKKRIDTGKWLHVAGSESLLKALPRGNWIGGTTEYFMDAAGGVVTAEQLFVQEIPYPGCRVSVYDERTISRVSQDACDNGFTILILPFDTGVHAEYAKHAPEYENLFLKNIVGWVSGTNLAAAGQTPAAVDGTAGTVYTDKAVALHVELPPDKLAAIQILNIFEQDDTSPVIEFREDSFRVRTCLVDGKETVLADYLKHNRIDVRLPLVGAYSGSGVNVSFKSVEDGVVNFFAPVFPGIRYRIAKPVPDYVNEFLSHVDGLLLDAAPAFSCNCILNFQYGQLEGKKLPSLAGPITFGEIAYQLVNQTYVYLMVL